MKKSIILALVAFSISGCSTSLSDELSKGSLIDVVTGSNKPVVVDYMPIRGFDWNEDVAVKKDDLLFLREQDNLKVYTYKKDTNKIGEVELTTPAEYLFYKNKLSNVLLTFAGYKNFNILKQSLDQKYGTPFKGNRYIDSYLYTYGDKLTILLRYNSVTDEGYIYYSSISASKIIKDDTAKSAIKSTGDL